jgi:hypothetical protein
VKVEDEGKKVEEPEVKMEKDKKIEDGRWRWRTKQKMKWEDKWNGKWKIEDGKENGMEDEDGR